REAVMERMVAQGVTRALLVAVDLDHMERLRGCCRNRDGYSFSLGLHPNHQCAVEPTSSSLLELARAYPEAVAIGETGLDYFRNRVDRSIQKQRFISHLEAAAELKLPIIIHMRDADRDTLDILRSFAPLRGVMHCFSADLNSAQTAIEFGLHISFSGNITFKRNDTLRRVAAATPLQRLLIETDSPYLAPVPMRGKRNEPTFVTHVAAVVAEQLDIAVEELAAATTANARQLFAV
ncbi:MAG: TatD family hydrolase, partial [Mariprofundales bacterium]|nr:TatD family hydrolase [Mariprofundales bacterium]